MLKEKYGFRPQFCSSIVSCWKGMSRWLRISVLSVSKCISFHVMLLFVSRWLRLMCVSKQGPELEEDTF